MPKRRCSRPLEEDDFRDASDILVQDAPIFDPAVYEPLIQIINKLDPASFLKFSRTCRVMKHLCFFSKGIEVRLGGYSQINDVPSIGLKIRIEDDESAPEGVRFVLKKRRIGSDEYFTFSEELLEKVLKMPFRFIIQSVYSVREELNGRQMKSLGQFLRRFRRLQITLLSIHRGTSDWNSLVELVQEFRVEEVHIFEETTTPIPQDLLLFFVTNLSHFEYYDYVPDDVLLAATAEQMGLLGSDISVDTFKKLLEKFATGEVISWVVGRHLSDIDFEQGTDPFRSACSEVMKVVQVENAEAVDKEPGVLYWSPPHSGIFHMECHDGSDGVLEIDPGLVAFG